VYAKLGESQKSEEDIRKAAEFGFDDSFKTTAEKEMLPWP
jgi:hypothetical protein